jgi:hypothetical protein
VRKLREAMHVADAMQLCVLCIGAVEEGLSSGSCRPAHAGQSTPGNRLSHAHAPQGARRQRGRRRPQN